MNRNKRLETITYLTVGSVALISFILSFSNIQQLANENGYPGMLSFLVPLIIDGGLLVFAFVLLDVSISHNKQPIAIKGLIFLFVLISVGANIAHSNLQQPVQIALAIVIPLTLAFSFESVVWRIKIRLEADEETAVAGLEKMIDDLRTRNDELHLELQTRGRIISELKSIPQLQPETLTPFGMAFISFLQGEQGTAAELSERFPGVSPAWISRTKNRLLVDEIERNN